MRWEKETAFGQERWTCLFKGFLMTASKNLYGGATLPYLWSISQGGKMIAHGIDATMNEAKRSAKSALFKIATEANHD